MSKAPEAAVADLRNWLASTIGVHVEDLPLCTNHGALRESIDSVLISHRELQDALGRLAHLVTGLWIAEDKVREAWGDVNWQELQKSRNDAWTALLPFLQKLDTVK